MVGRNGIDQLGIAAVLTAVLLNLIGRNFGLTLIGILAFIVLACAVFRILSRNIDKRREENMRFVRIWNDIKEWYSRLRAGHAQAKAYKFFKCPGCKNRLRVPKGKGKMNITCPKCGQRFTGKS